MSFQLAMIQVSPEQFFHNMEQSYEQVESTCRLLSEIELAIPTGDTKQLDALLDQLAHCQQIELGLAELRQPLIDELKSGDPAGPYTSIVLNHLPDAERQRAELLFSRLRKSVLKLHQSCERTWNALRVREEIVDRTLNILLGSGSQGYGSTGATTASQPRPILQHRC